MPDSTKKASVLMRRIKKASKAVGQVMMAMKSSNNDAGPTMTEIVKFIMSAVLQPATKRQVITALKHSVEFGILKRHKGHYFISETNEPKTVQVVKASIPLASVDTKKTKQPTRKSKVIAKSQKKIIKVPKRLRRARKTVGLKKSNSIAAGKGGLVKYPKPPLAARLAETNARI